MEDATDGTVTHLTRSSFRFFIAYRFVQACGVAARASELGCWLHNVGVSCVGEL
jgi:hypothetical protein